MKSKYSANDIAEYVIEYCNKHNLSISNLRLQRLLYFIQAYFLMQSKGERAAFSDDIEAWDVGPVIPNVFNKYKRFGTGQIPYYDGSYADMFPDDNRNYIEDVIEYFKDKSSVYMMEITHRQKPWSSAYNRNTNNTISIETITDYFLHNSNVSK